MTEYAEELGLQRLASVRVSHLVNYLLVDVAGEFIPKGAMKGRVGYVRISSSHRE